MKTKSIILLFGAMFISVVCCAPAIATTYNYVGTPYSQIGFGFNTAAFGSFMTGTVSFTSITPGTYSLSGGKITNLSLSSGSLPYDASFFSPSSYFVLQSGLIANWFIDLSATPAFGQYGLTS